MLGNHAKWFGVLVGTFWLLSTPTQMLSHHGCHRDDGQPSMWGAGCGDCFHGYHHCGQSIMSRESGCQFCLQGADLGSATSVRGKVESVHLGPGQAPPYLEIVTEQSEKLKVLVAPFWYLKDQGIEVKAGDAVTLSVVKVHTAEGDRNIALELKNKDGKTLKLRDEDGLPIWMR